MTLEELAKKGYRYRKSDGEWDCSLCLHCQPKNILMCEVVQGEVSSENICTMFVKDEIQGV